MKTISGAASLALCVAIASHAHAQVSVLTYHADTQRTGWNGSETTLTPANVAASLHLLSQTMLDDDVEAQPLVVAGTTGAPDTVYIVTAANTVYAINAATGAIQHQTSLGTPVPQSALPGACDNNSGVVGVESTPVIDAALGVMFVLAYTYESGQPVYRLHALKLSDLTDSIPTRPVTAAAMLSNHTVLPFNAAVSRQRPALLESNGTIYAGFGSFCDFDPALSRGWLLGWTAQTLAPLPTNFLVNQKRNSVDGVYLSSIWMSGYGPAADPATGSVFFVTGNSDQVKSYSPTANLSESVIKISADLATVQGHYTPNDPDTGHVYDDLHDGDLGAGGVMVVPTQPGPIPNMAVISGKNGDTMLLDRDTLDGSGPRVVQSVTNYGCWCGPSYFVGPDGAGRVVVSTGKSGIIYKFNARSKLVKPVNMATLPTGQAPGFFTTISSNGTTANTAIIWAITRPNDNNPADIFLYAFDAATGAIISSAVAGTWPFTTEDANLVPTVANGQIYVASYRQLSIFGVDTTPQAKTKSRTAIFAAPPLPPRPGLMGAAHEMFGTTVAINGNKLSLRRRDGQIQIVDITQATEASLAVTPVLGTALHLRGDFQNTTFVATTVLRAKNSPALWAPDR